MYQWILFSKLIICLLSNISRNNKWKMHCHRKSQGYMCICRNAEGVHTYLLKCWRGTCSSVGMLKGYTVRERLGTRDLYNTQHSCTIHLHTKVLLCTCWLLCSQRKKWGQHRVILLWKLNITATLWNSGIWKLVNHFPQKKTSWAS